MSQQPTSTPAARDGLSTHLGDEHGHGTITRLLEELATHVELLESDVVDASIVLAECQNFVGFFLDELRSHFLYEERDVFPLVAQQYPAHCRAVATLLDEHKLIMMMARDVEGAVSQLVNAKAIESPVDLPLAVTRLSLSLDQHLAHEEALFDGLVL